MAAIISFGAVTPKPTIHASTMHHVLKSIAGVRDRGGFDSQLFDNFFDGGNHQQPLQRLTPWEVAPKLTLCAPSTHPGQHPPSAV